MPVAILNLYTFIEHNFAPLISLFYIEDKRKNASFSTYFGANMDLAIQDLLVMWKALLASVCVLCGWTSFCLYYSGIRLYPY